MPMKTNKPRKLHCFSKNLKQNYTKMKTKSNNSITFNTYIKNSKDNPTAQ